MNKKLSETQSPNISINCRGRLVDLTVPKVMGILNLTPDSFYDGGLNSIDNAVCRVEKMLSEGADFIDIGAVSTRPGAESVPVDTEKKRLLPVLELLLGEFPDILISIDTYQSEVAELSLQAGAAMINDISGGQMDASMMAVVAKHSAPYVLTHMQGTPRNMQQNPKYDNVTFELIQYFSKQIQLIYANGINDVIIDPGFGFGKTVQHNYQMINELGFFKNLDCPILVGVSRKSMIYKVLKTTPGEALNGTSALHALLLKNGANILRVHDVKEARECVELWQMMR